MIDAREQLVLDLIDANQQEIIDLLRALLAFETITPSTAPVEHDRITSYNVCYTKLLRTVRRLEAEWTMERLDAVARRGGVLQTDETSNPTSQTGE